jgi:hypothetical protein
MMSMEYVQSREEEAVRGASGYLKMTWTDLLDSEAPSWSLVGLMLFLPDGIQKLGAGRWSLDALIRR